jgi:hypothetical protein
MQRECRVKARMVMAKVSDVRVKAAYSSPERGITGYNEAATDEDVYGALMGEGKIKGQQDSKKKGNR